MNKHWIIVLAMLVFAVGCDQKQKAAEDAQNDAMNAKVAEAIKNQTRGVMTKPGDGPPAEKDKDDSAEKTDEADTTESTEKKDDTEDNTEASDSKDKTEKSSGLNAKTLLDEAIAAAKTDNKAVFVHFTSAS